MLNGIVSDIKINDHSFFRNLLKRKTPFICTNPDKIALRFNEQTLTYKEFNERVFKWFEDNLNQSEFYLKPNVKIDKIVKSGQNYGDIDVLILDYNKKRLFSIECKDIESAKNPRQINQEIENFLIKKKNLTSKHQNRENWIKENE